MQARSCFTRPSLKPPVTAFTAPYDAWSLPVRQKQRFTGKPVRMTGGLNIAESKGLRVSATMRSILSGTRPSSMPP